MIQEAVGLIGMKFNENVHILTNNNTVYWHINVSPGLNITSSLGGQVEHGATICNQYLWNDKNSQNICMIWIHY